MINIKKRISEKGLDIIRHFEGCSLVAYLCPAGVWTIGWGRTKGVKQGDVITQKQADLNLIIDVQEYEAAVIELVIVYLTQYQFDALTSFVYNIGRGNFERSTMLKLLNSGKIGEAAKHFIKWNKANVNNKYVALPGLTRRRLAETSLFNAADDDNVNIKEVIRNLENVKFIGFDLELHNGKI